MAAKKDKMIPSEKERKRALKYATPAGTGRMWLTPPTIEIVGFPGLRLVSLPSKHLRKYCARVKLTIR